MIKQKLLFYPRVDKIISKLKICQVLRLVEKSVKNLNNFNTIKEGLVEVASTTYADIIEEYTLEEKNTNKNTNKCSA